MYRGPPFPTGAIPLGQEGLLGAPGFAPTDAVPYGGVAGRHRLAIQADLLAQAARDPGLRVGKLDPLRAHPAVATDHASLPVDQRDRMQRPGQIVPRPLSRSAHAAGPAPTAAAHIASYPAPFQLQPQATLHPVALPFNTHHSEARQAQDPRYNPVAIPRVLPSWLHIRERTTLGCPVQVGSRSFVQAVEQAAHLDCGPRRRPGITSDRCTQIDEEPKKARPQRDSMVTINVAQGG